MVTTPERTPTRTSTGDYWVNWYDSLVPHFGKKDARIIFGQYWEKRGVGTKANTKNMRDAMSKRGIEISSEGIMGGIEDSVGGMFDGIGSIFNIGKTAAYAAVGLVGLVVVGVVYSYMKRGISFDPLTRSIKA